MLKSGENDIAESRVWLRCVRFWSSSSTGKRIHLRAPYLAGSLPNTTTWCDWYNGYRPTYCVPRKLVIEHIVMTELPRTPAVPELDSEYLYGSAIERLVYWCNQRTSSRPQYQRPAKRETDHFLAESDNDGPVIDDIAKAFCSRDSSIRLGEDAEQSAKEGRHNEAHNWPLVKRIFVAAVICLYT